MKNKTKQAYFIVFFSYFLLSQNVTFAIQTVVQPTIDSNSVDNKNDEILNEEQEDLTLEDVDLLNDSEEVQRIKMLQIVEKQNENHVNPPDLQEKPILIEKSSKTFPHPKKKAADQDPISTGSLTKSFLENKVTQEEEECQGQNLRIPVLERQVSIGELYDARTDFLHIGERLWSSNLEQSNVNILEQDIPKTNYDFKIQKSQEDQLFDLEIGAEFTASLMSGQLNISGSGKYLNSSKKNSKIVRGILSFQMRTAGQKVEDLTHIHYLEDQFDRDDITHVVTGIEYGGSAHVTMDYLLEDSDDKHVIEGRLEASLERGSISISGKVSLDLSSEEKKFEESLSVRTFADFVSDEPLPLNPDDAIEFMKNAPGYIKQNNDGKGRAVYMTLTPLCLVQKNIPNFTKQVNAFYKEVKANVLIQLIREFEDLETVQLSLNTLKEDYDKAPDLVVGEEKYKILQLKSLGFEKFSNTKREYIRKVLIAYKSGDDTAAEEMIGELNEFKANDAFNTNQIMNFIEDEVAALIKTIRTINELQQLKPYAKVVEKDLVREMGDVTRNKVVLYYTVALVDTPDENFQFFQQLMKFYKPINTDYFIVLFDIIERYNQNSGRSFIEKYEPAGRFRKYLKLVTQDYRNYQLHDSAVIINPTEVERDKRLYYVGQLNIEEDREGKGALYTHADQVIQFFESGDLNSAYKYKVYEGDWGQDKFHGLGKVFKNGIDACEGEFYYGNTKDYITCTDGDYNGELNETGQRHGTGIQQVDPVNDPFKKCRCRFLQDAKIKQYECFDQNGITNVTPRSAVLLDAD